MNVVQEMTMSQVEVETKSSVGQKITIKCVTLCAKKYF